jgi:hypothetical protein
MIAVYTALGDKAAERQKVYEEYVSKTVSECRAETDP